MLVDIELEEPVEFPVLEEAIVKISNPPAAATIATTAIITI